MAVAPLLLSTRCASDATPSEPQPVLRDEQGAWHQIAAGDGHTCGLAQSGAAYCWGRNDRNQIGDGTTTPRAVPTPVGGGLHFTSIAAGRYTSCGVEQSGPAYCWGFYNDVVGTPALVDAQLRFTTLAVGGYKVCGLAADASVYCWSTIRSDPAAPAPLPGGLRFQSVVAGDVAGSYEFCGVATDGAVYCWADGITWAESRPVQQPLAGPAAVVATGGPRDFGHACVGLQTGTAVCWGANGLGQLGDGTTTNRPAPVPVVGGLTFAAIAATWQRTCAVTRSGAAYCWGASGTSGLLTPIARPAPVLPGVRFAGVTVGDDHTCFVTPGGAGYCLGENGAGQLGDGTTGGTNEAPTRVRDP